VKATGLGLRSVTFRDLPVLPYLRWRPAAPGGRLEGGPVFPPGVPEWVHMPLRGGSIWARGPEAPPAGVAFAPLPGRFALAGPAVAHFGHMLGEFLHRLWLLREDPSLTPAFVATARLRAIPAYVTDWLRLIGARAPVLLAAPTRLAEAVVGEPGRLLGRESSAAYGRFLGEMLPPDLLRPTGEAPRLAILRGHLQTGRCIGEAWLEPFLAREGYRILRPEALDLAAQIAALAGAERIVMSEGSAMHLLDVLPPVRAEVAVLARGPGSTLTRHCLSGKVARLALFRPRFMIGSLDPAHPRSNAIAFLEPHDFLAFLAAEGFIRHVPPRGFLEEPGLLEADLAAYAAHWGGPAAGPFLARAIASCRAGWQDPALRASLAPPARGP